MKCIVKDCTNHRDQGLFTGDLCYPCHAYISRGEGIHSQAYRNTQAEVLKEREACAQLCIQMGTEPMEWQPSKLGIRPEHWDVAQAIRARSKK